MKTSLWIAAALGAAGMAAVSQANTTNPDQKQLTQAVKAFLADHGDLCMAKYSWPRDVIPGDEKTDPNDAIQLPVLERLGVVRSVEIPNPQASTAATGTGAQPGAPGSLQPAAAEPGRRYSLTEKGRKYYLQKKHTVIGRHDFVAEHDADFCVAHLTLDKVVKWSPPEPAHDHLETVVRYTYHVKPADWMSAPDAQKVFPIADRVIRGDGVMLMSATVALQDGKWIPVMPGQ
jgi:hypothetical protein